MDTRPRSVGLSKEHPPKESLLKSIPSRKPKTEEPAIMSTKGEARTVTNDAHPLSESEDSEPPRKRNPNMKRTNFVQKPIKPTNGGRLLALKEAIFADSSSGRSRSPESPKAALRTDFGDKSPRRVPKRARETADEIAGEFEASNGSHLVSKTSIFKDLPIATQKNKKQKLFGGKKGKPTTSPEPDSSLARAHSKLPRKHAELDADSPESKRMLDIPRPITKAEANSPQRKLLKTPGGLGSSVDISPKKKFDLPGPNGKRKTDGTLRSRRVRQLEASPEESQQPIFIIPKVFSSSFDPNEKEDDTAVELHSPGRPVIPDSPYTELDSPEPGDTVCPMCKERVSKDLLDNFKEQYPRMTLQQEQRFCQLHQMESAKELWKDKGYPDIKWPKLKKRIKKQSGFLRDILEGGESHFGDIFSQKVTAGQNKTLLKSEANLTPGYYGIRGLRAMSESIIHEFSSLLRKRAVQDRLVSARGHTAYVQAVLVPELAVRLIMEDMDVDKEEARTIMAESSRLGELMNEEVADVVISEGEDAF
ncbi:RTC4-like domain-containing protein [Podospora didyma]|uniref:Restriction of telomere capping protein 4 n=1 Tax=Podospora didyma TaxID=330526 RepID=A0AAE0P6X4_9PEZI|nr:RTC4-like domain-containing protein [Podospora didyma]